MKTLFIIELLLFVAILFVNSLIWTSGVSNEIKVLTLLPLILAISVIWVSYLEMRS